MKPLTASIAVIVIFITLFDALIKRPGLTGPKQAFHIPLSIPPSPAYSPAQQIEMLSPCSHA